MSSPPGVMIYHEMRSAISVLDDAQKGRLFFAILEYSDLGVVPDFSNNQVLAALWSLVQSKIDYDHARYDAKVAQCRRAAAAREAKKLLLSRDTGRYPTTSTETPSSLSSSPAPAPLSHQVAPRMSDLEFEKKRREKISLLQNDL